MNVDRITIKNQVLQVIDVAQRSMWYSVSNVLSLLPTFNLLIVPKGHILHTCLSLFYHHIWYMSYQYYNCIA